MEVQLFGKKSMAKKLLMRLFEKKKKLFPLMRANNVSTSDYSDLVNISFK